MTSDIELNCINSFEDPHSVSLQSELLLTYKEGNFDKFKEKLIDGVRSGYIDVNHFYGNPINGTLLEIACMEHNKIRFVYALIYYGAEINIINDLSKKAPIHIAVENSHLEALKYLVGSKGINVNNKDGNGDTALHLAVALNNCQIIDILFEHEDLDINVLNSLGQTPLHVGLIKDNESSIRLLLHRIDIDLDSYKYNDQSCRDIIKQRYPDIGSHIDGNNSLFSLIKDGNSKKFIEMARINPRFLHENDGEYTYLQWACKKKLTDVVKTLLRLKVNPNDHLTGTDPPLVIACRGGAYDIVNALMTHLLPPISLKPVQGINALHAIFDGIHEHWVFFIINHEDFRYYNCLQTLLLETCTSKEATGRDDKLDINYSDLEENTILHRAAYIHDDRFVKIILKYGASIGTINKKGEYALELIKPSIFQEYLDSCISHNRKPSRDSSYTITYDYTMLIPPIKVLFSSKKKNLEGGEQTRCTATRAETDPLLRMSNIPELRPLLKHPVITSFLNLKWQIIRKFFYINLIIHSSFLVFLYWYILLLYNSPDNMRIPGGNDTVHKIQCFQPEKDTWMWTLSLLFCAILGVRELLQFVLSPWLYLKHPQNWLELMLFAVSMAMLFCQNEYFASLAILISATELILLMGQHPNLSTYIQMFKTVTWNFLKFLTWYAVLIVAFGFSFYILFKGDPNGSKLLEDPFSAVFKTIVMMTGEYDTGSISFDQYSIFNHFFFLSFVFFIAIVLFGLLNGLAVSDIQAIRADAEIVGIVSRIKLISYFEGLTFCDPLSDSNSSNEPNWLSACYELQQRLGQKKTKLFSRILKIDFFFDILPDAKAHVYPNRDNKVEFLSEHTTQEKNSRDNLNKNFISWKMDPNIVKASRVIIESSSQTGHVEEMIKNCSEQLQTFKSKFESIENILMEIKTFWKEKSE